jgi:hypothetical protein
MRADHAPAGLGAGHPLASPGGRGAQAIADIPPHSAAEADRVFLAQLAAATRWWARQRTWRVSSSHTGGGVIQALETMTAASVAPDALGLALPSGTSAMVTALMALGAGPGDKVGVPAIDWPASGAILDAIGAIPVPLPVDAATGLLDPSVLPPGRRAARSSLTVIVAVHLHGLTCDVPAIRRSWPGIPVVEDAARAWAARYPDGAPVGSAADACAFSFGAGKSPDAGELGSLVTRDPALHRAAIRTTQHPTRQLLAGIPEPALDQIMTRVAPAAALLGAYLLDEHASAADALRAAARHAGAALAAAGLRVLSDPARHVPGVVTVSAQPSAVRAALTRAGLRVAAVDGTDTVVHPACPPALARATRLPELTVVTCHSPG